MLFMGESGGIMQQVTGINGAGTIWAQMRGIHVAAFGFYLH